MEGLGWASLNTGLHGSVAVMIDLRGSSANTENLLRICSGPANRLKETVQNRTWTWDVMKMKVEWNNVLWSEHFQDKLQSIFYHPQRSCEFMFFTPVSLSTWGGFCLSACWDTKLPPGSRPPSADGYWCGQYAAYWSAFLFILKFELNLWN